MEGKSKRVVRRYTRICRYAPPMSRVVLFYSLLVSARFYIVFGINLLVEVSLSIRKRYDEAQFLFESGRHEAGLIFLLICVAAASRLEIEASEGRQAMLSMGDAKMFERYIDLKLGRIVVGGVSVSRSLYKNIRNYAVHEAIVPGESYEENCKGIEIRQGRVVFGNDYFKAISHVLLTDRNVREDFRDILIPEDNILSPKDPSNIDEQRDAVMRDVQMQYRDPILEIDKLIEADTPELFSKMSLDQMRDHFASTIFPNPSRVGWNGGTFVALRDPMPQGEWAEGRVSFFDERYLPTERGYRLIKGLADLYETVDRAKPER